LPLSPDPSLPPEHRSDTFTIKGLPESVEGVWSLFKRSIIGSYHQISVKHMDSYLNELEWRFNERDNPFLFRDTLKRLLETERVEYKELIEKTA